MGGFDTLGFSDHVPWPYASGYTHPSVRMDISRLPEYLSSIRALAQKYKDRIRIDVGFECEYFPAYEGWLREMAEANALDTLILGNHYDETDETGIYFGRTETAQQLARYVSLTIRGLETGLFTYLAHPDLYMNRWPHGFDENARAAARELCEACAALRIPMEYNMHRRYSIGSLAGYPCRPFFEIARDAGVPILIGLDAHDPAELSDTRLWDAACQELQALDIERLEEAPVRSPRSPHRIAL